MVIINNVAYKLSISHYVTNGNTSVVLDAGASPFGGDYIKVSVNTDEVLPPGEFCVKLYSENEGLEEQLMASGLFEDTGIRIPSGHVILPVWRLKIDRLQTLEVS